MEPRPRWRFAQLTVAARDDNHIGFLPRGSVHWGSRRLPVGGSTRIANAEGKEPKHAWNIFLWCRSSFQQRDVCDHGSGGQAPHEEAVAESAAEGFGVAGAFPKVSTIWERDVRRQKGTVCPMFITRNGIRNPFLQNGAHGPSLDRQSTCRITLRVGRRQLWKIPIFRVQVSSSVVLYVEQRSCPHALWDSSIAWI
jgi:hypothetical protein